MKAKVFKISIALVILMIGFSSCKDAISEKDNFISQVARKTGGEDTDGPIIFGLLLDMSANPVYPAVVELRNAGNSQVLDSATSDEHGNFRFDLKDSGYYFLKVYQYNQLLGTSGTIHATDSSYVELHL